MEQLSQNKELTPLKAFNIVRYNLLDVMTEYDKSLFEIIEKALKRLEEKEHNCEVYLKQMNGLASKLAKYEKEHKALEIIKKKGKIKIHDSGNGHYALLHTIAIADTLTKEEFDLIKEVVKEYEN